jgi:hypothetical protein
MNSAIQQDSSGYLYKKASERHANNHSRSGGRIIRSSLVMRQMLLLVAILWSSLSIVSETWAQSVDACQNLSICNTSFEQFQNGVAPTTYVQTNQNNIPCWKTTAPDSLIEIWKSGYGGVPAFNGNYFAELNATQVGTLYQKFTVTGPLTLAVSFAHRGRYLRYDTMKVSIVGPASNPTTIPLGIYADNDSGWRYYTTPAYVINAANTGTYTLKFESISSNGGQGPSDGGNFLDSISVHCVAPDPCRDVSLCNTSFEESLNIVPTSTFVQTNERNIPCWKTTATDSNIEIWRSGYGGVPAYSGNYFAELNATQVGTLYQSFSVTGPLNLAVSFAHRGRYARPDVMEVWLVGPTGSGMIPFKFGTYTDNDSAWRYYTTPLYAASILGTYQIEFRSISSNGGNGPSNGGNFLDSITVHCATADPCRDVSLCNTSFEQSLNIVPTTTFVQTNERNIPCWQTTATDSNIEIWHSGYGGVPAYSGNYFAELNATQVGTLFQSFTVTGPLNLSVSFAHRGRYALPDVMEVWVIGPSGSGVLPARLGTYTDNDSAWRYYTTTPPYVASTTGTYRLEFRSISSNGGNGPSNGGNFLDSITVTCANPTSSTDGGCCDTAFYGVAASQVGNCFGCYPYNRDWRSINVINRKGTPITNITLQYFDCNGNPVTAAALSQLTMKNLHVVRDVPYLNRLLAATRIVANSYLASLNVPPAPSNNNVVSVDIGLPCNAVPNCWTIRLLIEHKSNLSPTGIDTCYETLPTWRPCPRIFPMPSVGVAVKIDSPIYVSTLTLNEGVPGAVGYVSFATVDSTDTFLGTTAGMWASKIDDLDINGGKYPKVAGAFQSHNTILLHLTDDSSGAGSPTFHLFIGAGEKNGHDHSYRPTIVVNIYDHMGGLLGADTVIASGTTTSIVSPTSQHAPETGAISIASITPNPAHTTIIVRYNLDANEQAKLELIDALGQQVGVLADGYQTKGDHTASFIVSSLNSGSYYLRLSTYNGQTSATVKVVH